MADRGAEHMQVKEDGHGKSCSLKRTEGRMNDVAERERAEGGVRGCCATMMVVPQPCGEQCRCDEVGGCWNLGQQVCFHLGRTFKSYTGIRVFKKFTRSHDISLQSLTSPDTTVSVEFCNHMLKVSTSLQD